MNRQREIHKDESKQGRITRYLSSTNTKKESHQTKSAKELAHEKRELIVQKKKKLMSMAFTEIKK